jgi:prepilin-type N-terminal cleavage/methylation domain-containing protein
VSAYPAFRARFIAAKNEYGFTLIEMIVVMVLLGITIPMCATTMSAVINRTTRVQTQNIDTTEARAALNLFVSDFQTASYGDTTTTPVISYLASSITFYSPDRMSPYHMRRVKYWVQGTSLMRQVTTSTNTSTTGPPWSGIGSDTGPIFTLVTGISNTASIFQYCGQNTAEMALANTNPTSTDLITWACTAPTSAATLNTIVANIDFASTATTEPYRYGTVATMRSGVNQPQTGASS